MNVLVVEDDPSVSSWVLRLLREEGHRVEAAARAADGRQLACSGQYDLAVVDLELPDGDGISVVRALRGTGESLPVLIMTGRSEDDAIVAGLDAGADDYLVKPVPGPVLKARVRAALRRGGTAPQPELAAGALRLDRLRRRVSGPGGAAELTAREFGVLERLMLRPGEPVPRSELLERVWGIRFDPGTNVVDVTVHRVRAKVERADGDVTIRAVRGVGFVLGRWCRLRARTPEAASGDTPVRIARS